MKDILLIAGTLGCLAVYLLVGSVLAAGNGIIAFLWIGLLLAAGCGYMAYVSRPSKD